MRKNKYKAGDKFILEIDKDIERRYMKAILEQRFGHMDKEAGHIGTNGLEEYSTTRLKAELRRRRSQPQGKGKDFRLEG